MQTESLTFGVWNVLNAQSRQNGTRVKCVDVLNTAFKRHVTVSSCRHHQGVVEQEHTKCLHLPVNPTKSSRAVFANNLTSIKSTKSISASTLVYFVQQGTADNTQR